MSNIKGQILSEIGALSISSHPIVGHQYYNNSLKTLLNSKEVRFIAPDGRDEIFGWEPTALLPEYDELWKGMPDTIQASRDYSGIKDGYGLCELFADSKRLIVTADYLKYIKGGGKGFVINVYGHYNTLISKRFWDFCDHPEGRSKFNKGEIPEYKFPKPELSAYTVLEETKYMDEAYIESCQDSMAILAINLPHVYYSTQNLKGNIFTWDIGSERYQVGGKDMYEIGTIIEDIAANGIREPLIFRINEGCLTPVDNDTAIMLFIATYMNLPTIPAILFMSDDVGVKNKGYEELHEILHSNFWHNASAMEMVNNILKPYFFFEMVEDKGNGILKAGNSYFAKSQYPSMCNIDDPELRVIDRYLDTKAEVESVQVPMSAEEIQAMKQRDAQVLSEKLVRETREHDDDIIQRILAGEFAVDKK